MFVLGAFSNCNAREWIDTMRDSMGTNQVCHLVDLLVRCKAIGNEFSRSRERQRSIGRRKTHLVVKDTPNEKKYKLGSNIMWKI